MLKISLNLHRGLELLNLGGDGGPSGVKKFHPPRGLRLPYLEEKFDISPTGIDDAPEISPSGIDDVSEILPHQMACQNSSEMLETSGADYFGHQIGFFEDALHLIDASLIWKHSETTGISVHDSFCKCAKNGIFDRATQFGLLSYLNILASAIINESVNFSSPRHAMVQTKLKIFAPFIVPNIYDLTSTFAEVVSKIAKFLLVDCSEMLRSEYSPEKIFNIQTCSKLNEEFSAQEIDKRLSVYNYRDISNSFSSMRTYSSAMIAKETSSFPQNSSCSAAKAGKSDLLGMLAGVHIYICIDLFFVFYFLVDYYFLQKHFNLLFIFSLSV